MNSSVVRKPFGMVNAFRPGRNKNVTHNCRVRGRSRPRTWHSLLLVLGILLIGTAGPVQADDAPDEAATATQPADEPTQPTSAPAEEADSENIVQAEEPQTQPVPDDQDQQIEEQAEPDEPETQPAEDEQDSEAEEDEPLAETQPATQPDTQPATQPVGKTPEQLAYEEQQRKELERKQKEEELKSKPRIELYVPSWQTFAADAKRSNSGFVAEKLGALAAELATQSATGTDMVEATSIFSLMNEWPDAAIECFYYVPDAQGNLRWALRTSWPVDDLRQRLQDLLESDASETLFKEMLIEESIEDPDGPLALMLPETTLGYIIPCGENKSALVSHKDLELPDQAFPGTAVSWENGQPDIVLRFNFAKTEQDSDASFWSSVRAVTDVVYSARVADDGNWEEHIEIFWPSVVGMAAKTALGKVSQQFYVPDSAFGALTASGLLIPNMVEQMAGFGFDFRTWDPEDGFDTRTTSPLSRFMDDDFCFTFLPGEGFLPTPDIVIQTRAKNPDKIIKGIRKAAGTINRKYKKKEIDPPWYEQRILNRTVFWKKTEGLFASKPVLFMTKEVDDKGREHDMLVIGLTSTDAEDLVTDWLSGSRSKNFRYLPSEGKPHGELWANSRLIYEWIVPYINLGLSGLSRNALLPEAEEVKDQLIDGRAILKLQYTEGTIRYSGPLPVGVAVLPTVFQMAIHQDQDTDLAKERFACKRLKILYRQCELFHDDYGRWPAELAELDGYIDFAGNPYLLELPESRSHRRPDIWRSYLGFGSYDYGRYDDWDDEEEDEQIDDSLYVIDWQPESWSLGYAPDTFRHLEELYIDQDGDIHSIPKQNKEEEQAGSKSDSDAGHDQ